MGIKVTGYSLRTAIKRWTIKRDSATHRFPTTLHKFKDEAKANPEDVAAEIEAAESAIARLQTAQVLYNAQVEVELGGKTMKLAEAVKRMGGATRMEKLWKGVAGLDAQTARYRGSSIYGETAPVRNAGQEVADKTLSPESAAQKAAESAAFVSALQEAIASGNGTKIELDIDNSLFE